MPDSRTPEDPLTTPPRGPDFVVPAPPSPEPPEQPVPAAPESVPRSDERPRRRAAIWTKPAFLVGAVALLVLAGVIGALIMNSVAGSRALPEDTARAFVEAGYRSDCAAVRATIADEFWDGGGLTCQDVSFHGADFGDTTVEDWAFTDTEITGELARITLDPPGEIASTVLRMRLVEDTWKITDWQF